MKWNLLSHAQLFVTPWTIQSMNISENEIWQFGRAWFLAYQLCQVKLLVHCIVTIFSSFVSKSYINKIKTHMQCWKCKLVQMLWKTVWQFLEKLKIEFPYDSVIPLLGIYSEKMKLWFQKSIYASHIHCNIIFNSQNTERTLVSIGRWVDKENMMYVCNGVLFSH